MKLKDNSDDHFKSANSFSRSNLPTLLPRYTLTNYKTYLSKKPAYLFHHLMKCGGSSAVVALANWFNIIYDHILNPEEIDRYIERKHDMNKVNSETCIVGHYAYDRTYLFQRYHELL